MRVVGEADGYENANSREIKTYTKIWSVICQRIT